MSTYVFLGPSLRRSEAEQLLPGAILRPPAKAGDVYLAVKAGARVVAIVDGYFEQIPSVWHKEVLYALSCGTWVFGASSMGALRAAELEAFGMIGVGRVFEAFRDGRYEDDDEVAVRHTAEDTGYKPLSEAMVNVRHALSLARQQGLIDQVTHDVLVREMKRTPYPGRSWHMLRSLADQRGLPTQQVSALLDFVASARPNVKRDDAVELLTRLGAPEWSACKPFAPSFTFESTVFWDQLVAGTRSAPSDSARLPVDAVRSHVGVVEDDAEAVFHGALLLYLVVKEAHRVGLEAEPERVTRISRRFLRSHGLSSAEEWSRTNDLGEQGFAALMDVLALVERVATYHSVGLDAFLPAELHRQGRFGAVRDAVARKLAALEDFGGTFPSAEDLGTTTDDLLDWYAARFRPVEDLEDHIAARRLPDGARFVRELLSEYLVDPGHSGSRP